MAGLVIFMGPTGAGKTVQAERLASDGKLSHISSGELLRHDPSEAAVLASGQLVPSADVERLVEAAIDAAAVDKTIILDGFPRTLDEAQWLETNLDIFDRTLSRVVLFRINFDVSMDRLSKRQRSDDTPEALRAKWDEYNHLTEPVIAYYQGRGLVTMVDGSKSVDAIYNELHEIIR